MTSLEAYLGQTNAAYLDDCTRCGKCVEICPVTPVAGIDASKSGRIVDQVVGLLGDGPALDGDAKTWAHQCNGCGICIPACPENINPRRMIMLAGTVESRRGSETPQLFRKMARAIRIMAAMQLAPPEFQKLLRNPRAREVPVVFYLGCNPIRTPHLLFNAMTILDALEIDYETVGGPGACCGIIHSKWEGEIEKGERVVDGTLYRFGEFTPDHVLSWCPSCVLHLGETLDGFRDTSFNFDHITDFMVGHAVALSDRFVRPVERRVLLHVHEGMPEIGANVAEMLGAIPGLTIVDTVSEPGYTCGGSGADRSPALKRIKREETLARAEADDIDALITLFHGCHGQLGGEESRGAFEVLNWTDLVVEALGETPHDDVNKRFRLQQDWDLVLDEGEIYLKANGIDVDREWLKGLLPDIFAQTEFKGGLECFGTDNQKQAN
jgi:Fe-S oxidoreductase